MTRKWLDNAFWENKEDKVIRGILVITDENGVSTTQELTVAEKAYGGGDNVDYLELIEQIGIEQLDKNTEERNEKSKIERERHEARQEEIKKTKALEALFEAKLKAFEIEEVKSSNNRTLKTKLRRAKNTVEVNIYTMMIVMEQLENENRESEN